MKRVVSNDEIAHLWFHQTQPEARNAKRSYYFEGDTIYSYGRHFPIARHVETKRGKAVLFTTESRSITTTGHTFRVRSAIPNATLTFYVPSFPEPDSPKDATSHKDNFAYFAREIETALGKSARARKSWAIESYHGRAGWLVEQCKGYCKFFALRVPKLPTVSPLNSEGMEKIKAKEAERKAAERKENARLAAERAEHERTKCDRWRAGEYVGSLYNVPVMLRIGLVGGESVVETSRGARVPVSHALLGLAFVRKVVKSGVEYVRNGHTFHLGTFPVDRIETDGTLHAGCHVISFAEIERLVPELEKFAES